MQCIYFVQDKISCMWKTVLLLSSSLCISSITFLYLLAFSPSLPILLVCLSVCLFCVVYLTTPIFATFPPYRYPLFTPLPLFLYCSHSRETGILVQESQDCSEILYWHVSSESALWSGRRRLVWEPSCVESYSYNVYFRQDQITITTMTSVCLVECYLCHSSQPANGFIPFSKDCLKLSGIHSQAM